MSCFSPVTIYRGCRTGTIYHQLVRVNEDYEVRRRRCGYCLGCRLDAPRNWAIRLQDEASLHAANSFVTLTYADDSLPENESVCLKEITGFLHRYRKRVYRDRGDRFRYYYCAEYGRVCVSCGLSRVLCLKNGCAKFRERSRPGRPHFHIALFGTRPGDLVRLPRRGVDLYKSAEVLRSWEDRGFVSVGDVTFESAAYVASYVTKKVYGKKSEEYYGRLGLTPEFANMSKKPGLGANWLKSFMADVYPCDEKVVRRRDGSTYKSKPPRYYDRLLERVDPGMYAEVKEAREWEQADLKSRRYARDGRTEKEIFEIRRALTHARFEQLSRSYEDEC